ncbi:MFS transporter [Sphingobium amiense]|uniref:MFS transporter n=1 Tax=Sphingobium amiense TaxID=135719 RepID=A0A494W1W7_9SPHN|nr:MFS transporter [Sphingobium amiense]BBD97316.1 MFS transporter [Sphingobium amiense]
MTDAIEGRRNWRDAVRPYAEKGPLAALALGISSGFPFAMIGGNLASRLAQDGIDKKSVTAFSLVLLAYNFKFLWAWVIEGVKIPVLHRLGQRVSWMLAAGVFVMASVIYLGFAEPTPDVMATVRAAILVGIAGATFDIIIDGYRIEILKPEQLGVGAGMSQYGWRIGAAAAGGLGLVLADQWNWTVAYIACSLFALPAMIAALIVGEPQRHRPPETRRSGGELLQAVIGPFVDFFRRRGALLVLTFIIVHKIGDTLANLTFRLLFNDLGYTNTEIAIYDVGVGFWALLAGIFVGGVLYARLGLKKSVLISLILMAVSNFSFAALAAAGKSNLGMAGAIGFENFASGVGGVAVVAYFSALCDLRFTAAQYALISAAASIVGRFLTGTTAGAMIERFGYVDFYLLTTVLAVPGILLFWLMMRAGLIDASVGTAATEEGSQPA